MGKDQRKITNYLKTAGLSKGYYMHVFAGGVAFLGILLVYASKLLNELSVMVANLPDVNLASALQDRLFLIALLFFVSFLAFVSSTVFYMIVLGQRVGGPLVAICAYIQQLQSGKYDPPRPLRKNDELVPIHNELKNLAEILRKDTKR